MNLPCPTSADVTPLTPSELDALNALDALRPDQFARVMNISRTSVFKLMASGEIRSFKLGRIRLIPQSERARLRSCGGTSDAD